MTAPARFYSFPRARGPALATALMGVLLASCAGMQPRNQAVGLEQSRPSFSNGRVTVVLVDEFGIALPGMRVDLAWEEPTFYKTSAMTNREGTVSFNGVPEVAEVSVDHPGGIEVRTLLVPQTGRPELRLVLDTQGGGQAMRDRERELMMRHVQQAQTASGPR